MESIIAKAEEIASLMGGFLDSTEVRHNRVFIVTKFQYPDGDLIPLYVENIDGKLYISDKGTTCIKLSLKHLPAYFSYSKQILWIESICNCSEVEFCDKVIRCQMDWEFPLKCVMALLQAIIGVSTLAISL